MKLSKNFYLDEFEISQYATRKNYDNRIPPEYIDNIKRLVDTILQPLRNEIGSALHISSGYRSFKVNKGVGGSKNSAHLKAKAADIWSADYTPYELTQLIIKLNLPYEQVIHEFGRWTHVSVPAKNKAPRRKILTAHKVGNNVTRYALGNRSVDQNRKLV